MEPVSFVRADREARNWICGSIDQGEIPIAEVNVQIFHLYRPVAATNSELSTAADRPAPSSVGIGATPAILIVSTVNDARFGFPVGGTARHVEYVLAINHSNARPYRAKPSVLLCERLGRSRKHGRRLIDKSRRLQAQVIDVGFHTEQPVTALEIAPNLPAAGEPCRVVLDAPRVKGFVGCRVHVSKKVSS